MNEDKKVWSVKAQAYVEIAHNPLLLELAWLYGGALIETHSPNECDDDFFCCLHKLSDHRMRDFPQYFRADRGIMERICTHGVGHPDPDDLRIQTGDDEGIHACCGCCKE